MERGIAVLACLILFISAHATSQDTLFVPPGTGTLAAAVAADTTGGASHFPPDRVYRLQRGGTYLFCHFTGERLKEDVPGNDPKVRLYGAVMRVDSLDFSKGTDTTIHDPAERAAIEGARWIKLAYNGNYR